MRVVLSAIAAGMLRRVSFISEFCAEGVSVVREACPWQDCEFSASTVSQVDGCGGLRKISDSVSAGKNVVWILSLEWFPGICFLDYWGSWC